MQLRYWLTEGAELELSCTDPAAYLTALCREGVAFSDVTPLGEGRFRLYVSRSEERKARETGEKTGILLRLVRYRGLFCFLRRFRKRLYLLLLPLLLFLAVLYFSTYIWQIDVEGGETLSRAQVLSALEECGVTTGVSGLFLRNVKIRGQMLLALPALKWCTVQVHGSRAVVVIRERTEPPKMEEASVYQEVIAAKTGLITFVSVLQGKPLVKKGDMVMAGQVLISGNLTDIRQQTRQVHAFGEVWARTWYEKTLEAPLACLEKSYTGEETRAYALKICDFRLNFYGNSGISGIECDKMETEHRAVLWGRSLPVSVTVIRCREYETLPAALDETTGEQLLELRLRAWLDSVTDCAEITSLSFSSAVRDGVLSVTMEAECREQIGTAVPLTETKESDLIA